MYSEIFIQSKWPGLGFLSLLYLTVEGGRFGLSEFLKFMTLGSLFLLLFPSRIGTGPAAGRAF
jgi:hypothetical protein